MFFTPLPLSRNIVPGWVPGGTRTDILPSSVGTSISAPWAGLSNAENPARGDDLSAPAAPGAAARPRPCLGARALAILATFRLGNSDLLFTPVRGFFEGDFHVVPQIISALCLARILVP